jgi:hypothetical protein
VTSVEWSEPLCKSSLTVVVAKGMLEKARSRTCPARCVGCPGSLVKSMLFWFAYWASSVPPWVDMEPGSKDS